MVEQEQDCMPLLTQSTSVPSVLRRGAHAVSYCALVQEMRLQGPFQGQFANGRAFRKCKRFITPCCKLLRTDAEKQMGSMVDQRQFASLPMLKKLV